MANGKLELSSKTPTDAGIIENSLLLELPADHLTVIADKAFTDRAITLDSITAEGYPYEAASGFFSKLGGAEFEANALDFDDFELKDIGDIGKLIDEGLRKAKVVIVSGTDADQKRNVEVTLFYDGEEVGKFDLDNLQGLVATANSLESEEPEGAEQVLDNGTAPRRVVRRFRITNDGDDDSVANNNSTDQKQMNNGLIVTTAVQSIIGFGANGSLVFQIA